MGIVKKYVPFGGTRMLEAEIKEFLDIVSETALLFRNAVQIYMANGADGEFEDTIQLVSRHETRNDHLRRSIETRLYSHTLMPESRGDVLGLLENLDHILSLFEDGLYEFSIETPDIPAAMRPLYEELAGISVQAVESLVLASRAFFASVTTVDDHMHKVMFYEKQADKLSIRLKRAIFASDLPLDRKAHLRTFCNHIDGVANCAEDVADRLAIYAIKRSV